MHLFARWGVPYYARYTLARHLPAAVCQGALFAMLMGLGDVVLVKGLHGSDAQVVLLSMLFPLSLLLAPLCSGLMVGRSKRWVFLGAGLLGRAPLLLMPWVGGAWGFLALLALSATSYALTLPAQNTIFQANYPSAVRGRIFGFVAAASSLSGVAAALLAGRWLHAHPETYGAVYAVAGGLGLYASWLMSRIKIRGERRRWGRRGGLGSVRQALSEARSSLVESVKLFREEKQFRRFELGFFLYGLAFMALQPMLSPFLVRELGAGYFEAALAKQGFFGLANVACLPLWGRIVDRLGPIRTASRAFMALALSPLMLAGSFGLGLAYLSFVVRGAAMAGVNILWNLASIHFARDRDAAPFQAVHIALVGVRGALGPLLGGAALALGEPRLGMVACALLLVLASAVMVRLGRERERPFSGREPRAQVSRSRARTPCPAR